MATYDVTTASVRRVVAPSAAAAVDLELRSANLTEPGSKPFMTRVEQVDEPITPGAQQ